MVEREWGISGMTLTWEDQNCQRTPCPSVTFFVTSPTCTTLGLKPDFHWERQAINCLSHCMCMLVDGQISAVKWLCVVHDFSQTYLGIWKRNKEGTLFCSIWWERVLRSSCILQIWGSMIRVDSTFLETRLKFLLCKCSQ